MVSKIIGGSGPAAETSALREGRRAKLLQKNAASN
jgi:hypothetical protein